MPQDDIQSESEMMRPNFKIISSPSEPVYTTSISTNNPQYPLVTQDLAPAFAQLGKRFTTNTGARSVTNNGFLVLQAIIPANTGKTIYVDRIRAGTDSTSVVDVLFALVTGTTAITPLNTNLGSTNTTAVTAGYLVSSSDPITAGTVALTFIQGGGTTDLEFNGRIVIPSKTSVQNICIRLKNTGSGAQSSNSAISFSWWEV